MKLITHPFSLIFLMLGGFLLSIEMVHIKSHHDKEVDVHGYVKQYCRKNRKICKSMIGE